MTQSASNATDRIEALLSELAMIAPELAPMLARVHFESRPTAEVLKMSKALTGIEAIAVIDNLGHGYLADDLVVKHPTQARSIMAHETMHLVAEASAQIRDLLGTRWNGDTQRANRATDRWINQILSDIGVLSDGDIKMMGVLMPPEGLKEAGLVELWDAEKPTPSNCKGAKPMAGCGPSGQDQGGGSEDDSPGDQEREQEAYSILAGLASYSPSLRKMLSPPPPTVRWQDALHEAAASARGSGQSARPRTTRAKVGRRSTEDIPRPGKSTKRPLLVVVVDISGSMTGLLDKVVAESDLVAKHAEVRLVLHDAQVLYAGPYKGGRHRIAPAGGTDFVPAMREAERQAKDWPGRSVVVHLTDGYPCGEWPDVPGDFASGYAGIFGDYTEQAITAPGRWRTRRCEKVK